MADDITVVRTESEIQIVVGGTVSALGGLDDVTLTSPADSDFLVYNGTVWVNENAATSRTSLGLGSIATQAANNVAITGGAVTGITDITIADGGTGSSTASAARTALGVEIGVDVQAFDADTAKTDVAQEYSATQNFNATSLTSASASIAWDASANQVAKHTATENTTLANPTNLKDGATYVFIFTQDSTARTLAFGSVFKWAAGTAPTVSTGSGAVDILTFISDGTNMYGVIQQDFS